MTKDRRNVGSPVHPGAAASGRVPSHAYALPSLGGLVTHRACAMGSPGVMSVQRQCGRI